MVRLAYIMLFEFSTFTSKCMSIKFFFTAAVAVLLSYAASFAQNYLSPQNLQPFEDSIIVPEIQPFSNEAGIGYGILPLNDFNSIIQNLFPSATGIFSAGRLGTGSVSIAYLFNLNSPLFAGAVLSYSGNMGVVAGQDGSYVYRNFFSLMPQLKYVWFSRNNGLLRMYSRCAIGVALLNIRAQQADVISNRVTAVSVAFQISPLGFEVGRSLAGFIEIGFGTVGVASLGVRTRF